MARPKAFDRDQALQQALQIFWAQGYEATTMTDLRKGMGIGRQSLYDTFGDKRQLFDEALRFYVGMNDQVLASTLSEDAGLEGIRTHLHNMIRGLVGPSPRTGCLMMNTCVELSAREPEVAALTEHGLGALRTAFETALRGARSRGEVAANANLPVLAAFLTNQLAGFGVLAKSGASEQELLGIADVAMAQIGAPPSDSI